MALARRRLLNPMTGDVTLERGSPKADDTLASSVVLRLRMRRGSCPVNRRLGSRLHTIDRISPQSERLAADYAREALADLVERGDMSDLAVKTSLPGRNAIGLDISFRDRSGRARSVNYTHRVGAH